MKDKTIVVVGMGPSIGMSMARRWGKEGFRVGMVSRSQDKLDAYTAELASEGIEAVGYSADVSDREGLTKAIGQVEQALGPIGVLEYSPLIAMTSLVNVLDLDVAEAQHHIGLQLFGAITSVRAVVGGMIERGEGALMFTTGASAILSAPSHSNGSVGVAALRAYALMLHTALKPKGVYAGTVCIAKPHTGPDIADAYWDLSVDGQQAEHLHGDPRTMAAYEEVAALGICATFPPALTGKLPDPTNERDRLVQLMALYQVHSITLTYFGASAETDRVAALATDRGADLDAPYFGVDPGLVYTLPVRH